MDIGAVQNNVAKAAAVLKAMSSEHRLAILCELCKGERNVGDLEKIVNLSQSALSQHLARLREDKLVKTRRKAQTIYYSLGDGEVEKLMRVLCDVCGAEEQLPQSMLDDIKAELKNKSCTNE